MTLRADVGQMSTSFSFLSDHNISPDTFQCNVCFIRSYRVIGAVFIREPRMSSNQSCQSYEGCSEINYLQHRFHNSFESQYPDSVLAIIRLHALEKLLSQLEEELGVLGLEYHENWMVNYLKF